MFQTNTVIYLLEKDISVTKHNLYTIYIGTSVKCMGNHFLDELSTTMAMFFQDTGATSYLYMYKFINMNTNMSLSENYVFNKFILYSNIFEISQVYIYETSTEYFLYAGYINFDIEEDGTYKYFDYISETKVKVGLANILSSTTNAMKKIQ